MRVTTRTRYAIRALYDLAFHRLGQATQAKEIAERQKIPLRFLEQILQDLRKAGDRRGAARPARRLRAGATARARSRWPTCCTRCAARWRRCSGFDAPDEARRGERRPRGGLDRRVGARLVGVLEHATLQDFVARAEAGGRASAPRCRRRCTSSDDALADRRRHPGPDRHDAAGAPAAHAGPGGAPTCSASASR